MQIAIIHFHLNRGGVTQVVANHLRSLEAALDGNGRWRIVLVYGGRREGWPDSLNGPWKSLDVTLCEVDGLDYDADGAANPREMHARIGRALTRQGFSPTETLLHVHNHSLGKNLSLPGALTALAGDGYRMLLQIHDFAEDLRPEVYERLRRELAADDPARWAGTLYPQQPGIHYAVLNQRDERVLDRAGFRSERIHRLPNPVAAVGESVDRAAARAKIRRSLEIPPRHRWILYPVRGIARKNVGEMLLWSAALADRASFGLTLPPLNPQQISAYEEWKQMAGRLRLPCAFEVGSVEGLSFGENMAAADMIISTSLAEGFGMTFLESWLSGQYLIGRDLPDITADFVEAGVQLDSLHDRLDVPIEWIGREAFRDAFRDAYHELLNAFGQPKPDAAAWRETWSELERHDRVDFGSLTRRLQQKVIGRVSENRSDRERLLEDNAWFEAAVSDDFETRQRLIRHNAQVIRDAFSFASCGRRLVAIYEQLQKDSSSAVDRSANADAILESFVHPLRFRPVRSVE